MPSSHFLLKKKKKKLGNKALKLDSFKNFAVRKQPAPQPAASHPVPGLLTRVPATPAPAAHPNKAGGPQPRDTEPPDPAPHTHAPPRHPPPRCALRHLRTHLPRADESQERGDSDGAAAEEASSDGRVAAAPPPGASARRGCLAGQRHCGRQACAPRPRSPQVTWARARAAILSSQGSRRVASFHRSPPLRLRPSSSSSHSNGQRPASFRPANGRRGGRSGAGQLSASLPPLCGAGGALRVRAAGTRVGGLVPTLFWVLSSAFK